MVYSLEMVITAMSWCSMTLSFSAPTVTTLYGKKMSSVNESMNLKCVEYAKLKYIISFFVFIKNNILKFQAKLHYSVTKCPFYQN